MNAPIILTALLLLVPTAVVTADVAGDDVECMGPPCDQINLVCEKLTGRLCLGAAPGGPDVPDVTADAPTDCAASACGDVNKHVCQPLFDTDCVAAGSADAAPDCYGTPCDQINRVCERMGGAQCLGMAAGTDDCAGTPCDQINRVCERVGGNPCLGMAQENDVETDADPECVGLPCDLINVACEAAGRGSCVR